MPAPKPFKDALGARCVDDPQRLERYEIPERGARGQASCVLLPQTEAEVGTLLRIANQHDLKLVLSAGRTGLVEAQRPQGEAVLSLEKLSRPLAFALADGARFEFPGGSAEDCADALAAWWRGRGAPSTEGATLEVEAGVAIDAVNLILEPLELMFPMDMGSSSSASVGGCVANASAGANAVCYGTAAHMSRSASGFWGSGDAAGPCSAPPWQSVTSHELAIDSSHLHADWGLIGAQGVLGVVTRASLRTYALPRQREAALIPIAGMPEAMDILAACRVEFGNHVEEFEFISASAMNLVRDLRGEEFRLPFEKDPGTPYYILLQLMSHRERDVEDLLPRLYQFLVGELALPDEHMGYAPFMALKEIRHSITESSNHAMRRRGGGRLSFDTATPARCFGEYLRNLDVEIRARWPQMEVVSFGHAGVGGAHIHILGSKEQPVSGDAGEIVKMVFDVTQTFGGTFSAEHGIGTKWGEEFLKRAPAERINELVALKRSCDPRNVLSPRSFALDRALASAQ
jgi:FAD/FMN-containing dehydrogenase